MNKLLHFQSKETKKDHSCFDSWDVETDTIETDITLYAGWEKLE